MTEYKTSEKKQTEIRNFLDNNNYNIIDIMQVIASDNRLCLMNWFYKDHIENFIGESIDNNMMWEIREYNRKYLCDYYSEVFEETVKEIYSDIHEEKEEEFQEQIAECERQDNAGMEAAFKEGEEADNDGESLEDNPYLNKDDLFSMYWIRGFEVAQEKKKNKEKKDNK